MNKNTHFVSRILVASVTLSTLIAALCPSAAGAQKTNSGVSVDHKLIKATESLKTNSTDAKVKSTDAEVKGSAKVAPVGKSKSKLKTKLKNKLKRAGVKAEPLEIGDFGQTRS